MYIRSIIDTIINICNSDYDSFYLYNKIKDILNNIDNEQFLTELSKYNFIKQSIIKNNDYSYVKYRLYSSNNCDIIYIKWNKNAITKIHDHPDKGCIMKVLNGKITEECYDKYLSLISINMLNTNMIGYKISNKILHKIICNENTDTLHIYIPGNYVTNSY